MALKLSKTIGAIGCQGFVFGELEDVRGSTFRTLHWNVHKLMGFMFSEAFGTVGNKRRLVMESDSIRFAAVIAVAILRDAISIEDMFCEAIVAISNNHIKC